MFRFRKLIRLQSVVAKPLQNPNKLDLRVGFIKSIARHENADSLYVSQIEIDSDGSTVQVCSGLVGIVPMDKLHERRVVLVNNLKPSKMRGVKSEAMLLCADGGDQLVEPLSPLTDYAIGEKLKFEGVDDIPEPKKRIKSSVFAEIAENLRVNSDGLVVWRSHVLKGCGVDDPAYIGAQVR